MIVVSVLLSCPLISPPPCSICHPSLVLKFSKDSSRSNVLISGFDVASNVGPSSKILNLATSTESSLDTNETDALSLSPSASVTVCVNTIDTSALPNFANTKLSTSLLSVVSLFQIFLLCVNVTTPLSSVLIVKYVSVPTFPTISPLASTLITISEPCP